MRGQGKTSRWVTVVVALGVGGLVGLLTAPRAARPPPPLPLPLPVPPASEPPRAREEPTLIERLRTEGTRFEALRWASEHPDAVTDAALSEVIAALDERLCKSAPRNPAQQIFHCITERELALRTLAQMLNRIEAAEALAARLSSAVQLDSEEEELFFRMPSAPLLLTVALRRPAPARGLLWVSLKLPPCSAPLPPTVVDTVAHGDGDRSRIAAGLVLALTHGCPSDERAEALRVLRRQLADPLTLLVLERIGPASEPLRVPVTALLSTDSARDALEVLTALGPLASASALDVARLLQRPDESLQADAAHALGRMGPGARPAAPALLRWALRRDSPGELALYERRRRLAAALNALDGIEAKLPRATIMLLNQRTHSVPGCHPLDDDCDTGQGSLESIAERSPIDFE